MKISVVLTVCNDNARLLQTLRGFSQQVDAPLWELIVVNDGGYGDTRDAVHYANNWMQDAAGFAGLQYHYLHPRSSDFRLAQARNMGLSHAEGDRVIICDCDTVPETRFVHKHGQEGRPKDVFVGLRSRVPQSLVEGSLDIRVHDSFWAENATVKDIRLDESTVFGRTYAQLPDVPNPWVVCWGCNFSASADAMRRMGGFDESFIGWGGEDEDMAERLHRSGLAFHRTDALVYHLDHDLRTPQTASHHFKPGQRTVVRNGGPIPRRSPDYL